MPDCDDQEGKELQQIIDVHSHLLNFRFIPDSFFRTRAPVREWMLRRRFARWLARVITFIIPGKKYDRLHEALDIMRREISSVAEELVEEMNESGVLLSTPLMMDMGMFSYREKPEIPLQHQLKLISDIAAVHPYRIMPFVMIDPRRDGATGLVVKALEEMGFLGVNPGSQDVPAPWLPP
jgi:hypothetical protein